MKRPKIVTAQLLQFGLIISFFLSIFLSTQDFSFNFVKAQDDKHAQLIFDNQYLMSIPIKKIKVDDIEIAYKTIGTGYSLVMINGFGSVMDMWNAKFLQTLSSNHTIFIFDNRGIGNTSSGKKEFTIKQFAQDTFGLINALKLDKTDVLGFSMGGMVAQELTLAHPEKVRKLVIYASLCGTEQFNSGQKAKQVLRI